MRLKFYTTGLDQQLYEYGYGIDPIQSHQDGKQASYIFFVQDIWICGVSSDLGEKAIWARVDHMQTHGASWGHERWMISFLTSEMARCS